MESVVTSLSHQMKNMDLTELEPREQSILKDRVEKKILDARLTSCSTIEMIINRISDNKLDEKKVYVTNLSQILSRLRDTK